MLSTRGLWCLIEMKTSEMAKRFQRSARQAIVNVTVAMCLIAMGGHVALAQDDSFVRQRDFEATKNGSTGFSVSFADDRRSFRPGETIALVFTFDRYDISGFNYEHCGGLGNADAVLDHSDGTVNPQVDFENNGIKGPNCGVLGGVRGGVIRSDGTAEPQPPMQFAVFLNQAVRFDRPGKYRVYVRSRHRFLGHQGDELLPPLISNILEFDILERDRAWAARTLEEVIGVLNSSSARVARTDAARSLSYLGTAEAVNEIARRFGRNPYWGGPGDPDSSLNSHWRAGLYGARDRAHVVARLERELDRTDRLSRLGSSRIWRCLNSRADSNPGRLNAPPTHHVFIRIRPAISRRSRGPGSCEETWSTHSRSRPERSRASARTLLRPDLSTFRLTSRQRSKLSRQFSSADF